MTMQELYRELILSLRGIKGSAKKALADGEPVGDETLSDETAERCYGTDVKRKLITALGPVKQSYKQRLAAYRVAMDEYERELAWSRGSYVTVDVKKPKAPVVSVDLQKFKFLPELGPELTKCKLYLLLTAYCYILGKPDFSCALFIDEGQDYFFNEYKLLAECTKAVVNIYGDTNQQLVGSRGICDFGKLDALWDLKHYALNENYRNAREITEYVNGLLDMNVTSLGLDGGTVQHVQIGELPELLKSVGDDRVAVIYPSSDAALGEQLKAFVPLESLYTVAQSKGMEYERVYACGRMSDTEKYVAYTRALAKLYICE